MAGSVAPTISRNGCLCKGSAGLFRSPIWSPAVELPWFMVSRLIV